jgi:hypothetical protein
MNEALVDLALGLDSFVVCVGLGSLGRPYWTCPAFVLSFAAADAGGTAFGHILGQSYPHLPAPIALIAPLGMAAYACAVFLAGACIRDLAARRFGMALLPLLLSLDNFAAAALGRDGMVAPPASSIFIATAIMALAGYATGAALARRWPDLKRALPGGTAIAATLIMGIA